MPPSVRDLYELDEDDYVLEGGVEVIAREKPSDGVDVLDKVVFHPLKVPSNSGEADNVTYSTEGVEVNDDLFDTFMSYGCVGCAPFGQEAPVHPKGILKKSNRGGTTGPSLEDRNVSFSSLDIREFGITLGNHPNSCSGPPIRLDWDTKKTERVLSLDEYEENRIPRRKRRQLRYSYRHRKGVLEGEKGFTEAEVNEAWSEALKIQQQRQETLKRGLLMMTVDDVWESTQRKFKRIAESVGVA